MGKSSIYYLRKNKTTALPVNVMVLDTETTAEERGEVSIHRMYMGWTWRFTLTPTQEITRERWEFWQESAPLAAYIEQEARGKAPLYLIGSNITFDLFAAGLIDHLRLSGWVADMMYDKGLTTIILLQKGEQRLKILAVQNFLQGGVASWGTLLNLPKGEVDFATDSFATIREYCKRDTEITGRVFVEYLRFVRHHDMGGFALTASGQALRCFRHRFMDAKILHYDQRGFNQFIRAAYFGGRVECGVIGEVKGGPFTKLDVNSMYPAVMLGNYYPTKLRQWVKSPTLDYTQRQLTKYCGVAFCRLRTPLPFAAKRDRGRLIFPVGEFDTYLSTGSLLYALERGYIASIHQLMVFDRAKMFDAFVGYFYPLRQEYKAAGNAVYEKTVKIMLNSLYGKFGEKRERVLFECQDESGDFYRRTTVVPTSMVVDDGITFDWHYEPEPWMEEEYVSATEWSAFGKYQLTAGEIEGPQSAPAIAAHVTDYARLLLWNAMERVGLENVLYADTDSLIIPTAIVNRLGGLLHSERLGALKEEGQTTRLEIRGAKDYTWDGDITRKGIRSNAIEDDLGGFTQDLFPGLYGLMRESRTDGFPIRKIRKTLTHVYDKGTITRLGAVCPLVFRGGVAS